MILYTVFICMYIYICVCAWIEREKKPDYLIKSLCMGLKAIFTKAFKGRLGPL